MKNPIIETVSEVLSFANFLANTKDGKYVADTLIAIGFDGKNVHLVITAAPIADGMDSDVEIIKKWDSRPGFNYVGGMSFNGSNVGFLFDDTLRLLPSIQSFFNTLVEFMALRMAALGVDTIEESLELPQTHGALVLQVGVWMKNEVVNLKTLAYNNRPIEHFVLLDRTVGAIASVGNETYYVPATLQHMLEMDTNRWMLTGKTEKPIAYLSRASNGMIFATLKGEVSHQVIKGLNRLTPDNPRVITIGPETKGAGMLVGILKGKRKIALMIRNEDGTRRTAVVGIKNTKAPRVVREYVATIAA